MMGEMRDKKDRSILLIGSLDSESTIMKEKSLIYMCKFLFYFQKEWCT